MREKITTLFSHERGFSMVEMLIVLVIIAIVAALAVLRANAPNTQLQRKNVARQLKVAFERARFDSVKRHGENPGPATVVVGTTSYTLTTDINQDGVFQSGESVVTDVSPQNITIQGPGSLPVTVSFNSRGEATASDGSAAPLLFRVCNGSCPSTASASTSDIVLVTATGTVSLLSGAATAPTFGNANVTNVSSSAGISNIAVLPSNIP